jgi:hypothetical protein
LTDDTVAKGLGEVNLSLLELTAVRRTGRGADSGDEVDELREIDSVMGPGAASEEGSDGWT